MTKDNVHKAQDIAAGAASFMERVLSALAKPEVSAGIDRLLAYSNQRALEKSFAGKAGAVLGVVRDPVVNTALTAAFGFASSTLRPPPK